MWSADRDWTSYRFGVSKLLYLNPRVNFVCSKSTLKSDLWYLGMAQQRYSKPTEKMKWPQGSGVKTKMILWKSVSAGAPQTGQGDEKTKTRKWNNLKHWCQDAALTDSLCGNTRTNTICGLLLWLESLSWLQQAQTSSCHFVLGCHTNRS